MYSSLSTTSYEYSSLSVDDLLPSVARPKVSLDSHDVDACYGRPRDVKLDTSLTSTESYPDVGAEKVSFAACPTPAQLPRGSQFAAAVDLPGIVAGYPPPLVTAAAPPSIIGIRGVAAYTSVSYTHLTLPTILRV